MQLFRNRTHVALLVGLELRFSHNIMMMRMCVLYGLPIQLIAENQFSRFSEHINVTQGFSGGGRMMARRSVTATSDPSLAGDHARTHGQQYPTG